ncbi:rRNA maturation RNase YbeY [Virgibacillus halodenitrificans]|uniref:Endoribonuclease YbeY n=1 Tax=Virgibacillus halodenitrificans TaxID=1482 RepID=A0AAC9IYK0_VIRHA|nr:rRNA maturation RNase YbeY [Virgibacillus halodenitrificans]APC48226.1 rRNA maturation RNase YbeY [Virgibacillus halodenitrificans]MBD1222832.1 rRNA maturation RNase YbeY [Virgibacillus halodenitrificans]MCG1029230.1 rRNA maturation RNase YbeY [Virgibacillus halodenitrificans]MEC2160061.1 rRNA maturation RNase YbeY [Virgibacillus halodenitrificans]CDQ35463.1 Endoribonuclease YbeY [Virgibacillus halodenitrificans]
MHIDFHDQTNSVPSDYIDLLQRLVEFAAKQEGISREAEVSINFVNNKEIQELNRNYRQKDTPTDVISFAMQEKVDGEIDIVGEDIPLILGDIVISIDKAKEQAADYDHSLERELGFLAVHGFLHLLGYDHMSHEEEKLMFKKQEAILGEFGIER